MKKNSLSTNLIPSLRINILLMCCVLLFPLATFKAFAENRGLNRTHEHAPVYRAIIIANNRYDDENGIWSSLKTPINDANAVYQVLKVKYAFQNISLITDATRSEIISALDQLSKQTQENDNVLIYYAGHGYMDQNNERGYWIPSNAKGRDITSYVRNSTVKDEIAAIAKKAKHVLVIVDSCFSGTLLTNQKRSINKLLGGQRYYRTTSARKSVQVLTAGGTEYVDDNYAGSGHSPFSYFFIRELILNQQAEISLSEISNNIIKSVANNATQTPLKGTLFGLGDELGEFIFNNSGEDPHLDLKNDPSEIVATEAKPSETQNQISNTPANNFHLLPSFF